MSPVTISGRRLPQALAEEHPAVDPVPVHHRHADQHDPRVADRDVGLSRLGGDLHRPPPLGDAPGPPLRSGSHEPAELRLTIAAAQTLDPFAVAAGGLQAKLKVPAKHPFDPLELLRRQQFCQLGLLTHRRTQRNSKIVLLYHIVP